MYIICSTENAYAILGDGLTLMTLLKLLDVFGEPLPQAISDVRKAKLVRIYFNSHDSVIRVNVC